MKFDVSRTKIVEHFLGSSHEIWRKMIFQNVVVVFFEKASLSRVQNDIHSNPFEMGFFDFGRNPSFEPRKIRGLGGQPKSCLPSIGFACVFGFTVPFTCRLSHPFSECTTFATLNEMGLLSSASTLSAASECLSPEAIAKLDEHRSADCERCFAGR